MHCLGEKEIRLMRMTKIGHGPQKIPWSSREWRIDFVSVDLVWVGCRAIHPTVRVELFGVWEVFLAHMIQIGDQVDCCAFLQLVLAQLGVLSDQSILSQNGLSQTQTLNHKGVQVLKRAKESVFFSTF